MKLWQDLFGTDYGLMSIIGIIFMIGMGFWFIWFFKRKIAESEAQEEQAKALQTDGPQ